MRMDDHFAGTARFAAMETMRFLDKLGMTDYLVASDGRNFGYEQNG